MSTSSQVSTKPVRCFERFSALRDFFQLPAYVKLLLITQLCFNVGFYMVLPYLATYLRDHLALEGATVGLILGLRSFSQQGLFVLGGTLTDRYGPRPVILVGIVIRVAGFLALGLSGALAGVIAGVLMIGFAAALFSPAVESSIARAAGDVEHSTGLPRTQVFAMNSVSSQLGAVLGPLLGAILLLFDFRIACVAAALVFVLVWIAYWNLFPKLEPLHAREPIVQSWSEVLKNKVFLWFALLYSIYLVAYNQLYLALPVELSRSMGNDKLLGVLMAIGSVMIIGAQIPLTAWARVHLGARRSIPLGFVIMAAGFLVIAVVSMVLPLSPPWAIAPSVAMIILFTLGKMLASPFAADMVAHMAKERRLGAYYGLLNSFGGLAVLLGSTIVGALLGEGTHGMAVARPWLLIVVVLVASAVAIWLLLVRNQFGARQPKHIT